MKDNFTIPLYKDKTLWITLALYLIAFTDFISDYIPVSVSKVTIYIFAFLLIWLYSQQKNIHFRRINLINFVICPYLMMLFIRLVVDFVIPGKGLSIYNNYYTIIFFFVNAILIPILFYSRFKININVVSFCVVAGVLMSICFLLSLDQIVVESIAAASNGGQYDAGGYLDIISYGQYSSALCLIGFYLLIFHNKIKLLIVLSIVFVGIGLSGIVLSAARSAFISLLVNVGVLFVCKFGNFRRIVVGLVILFLLSNFFSKEIINFNEFLGENGFHGFNRIIDSFFNNETNITNQTSGRDVYYKIGLSLFLENPIFGSSYLLPNGMYVHNIFIEQFMALGIVGGFLFILMNCALIKYSLILAKHRPTYSIFSVLFIQNLIYGCFSMTIIGLTAYWLFAALVINLYTNYLYEKRIGNNSDL